MGDGIFSSAGSSFYSSDSGDHERIATITGMKSMKKGAEPDETSKDKPRKETGLDVYHLVYKLKSTDRDKWLSEIEEEEKLER